ncbi:apolipoprotein N-acyltransferase [Phenylobacterium deserti]|uniref:Apolipoprotein N-acyltransferase n=1 Tax=Phenylobacterium deserti TaxID=1914756 RepID=A0A328AQA1_9CAUL|nr:apolipoprotein N-acyltransferase [Phenylobacterium deserti]RAK57212.1 apolipoprotein N-acyltransferase [Phenylobacterium deserti]
MKLTSPWALRLGALLAGLAAGLAHPPFGLLPGLLGYALLLGLLDQPSARPLRQGFFRGWLAGVGYFAVSVWWVVEPFMVDAANQGWMAPFALVLMAGGLALFWGLAGLLYTAVRPQSAALRVLVLAGALCGLEWVRGHVMTGFPWNLPGETWAAGSAPSQLASLLGAYGLSWVTVAVAAAPAVLLATESKRSKALTIGAAGLALAALYGFGFWRMQGAPAAPVGPVVRVVQANIDQKEKWRPENLDAIFETYVALTQQPAARRPDIVVWPEGALPAVIDDIVAPGSPYAPRLTGAVAPGQTLLMGANRAELTAEGQARYFNSLIAFRRDPDGGALRVTAVYDKFRLVPFGEFMPLGEFATRIGFRSLVHMPEDFSPGPPPRPLTAVGMPPLQPLICYEALFPALTRRGADVEGPRAAWILNASNDAWFGMTSGPLQHLNIASYRAIEDGLPIVRATPTGVSAVIDAYGRIMPGKRLGLGELGVIDAPLPAALPLTPYARFGDLGFGLLLLVSAGVALIARVRRA